MKIKQIFFMVIMLLHLQIHSCWPSVYSDVSNTAPDLLKTEELLRRLTVVEAGLNRAEQSLADQSRMPHGATGSEMVTVRQELFDRLNSVDQLLGTVRDEGKVFSANIILEFAALRERVDLRLEQLTNDASGQSAQIDQRFRDQKQRLEDMRRQFMEENSSRDRSLKNSLELSQGVSVAQDKLIQILNKRVDELAKRQQTTFSELKKERESLEEIIERLEKKLQESDRKQQELEKEFKARNSVESSLEVCARVERLSFLVQSLEKRIEQIEISNEGDLSLMSTKKHSSGHSTRPPSP